MWTQYFFGFNGIGAETKHPKFERHFTYATYVLYYIWTYALPGRLPYRCSDWLTFSCRWVSGAFWISSEHPYAIVVLFAYIMPTGMTYFLFTSSENKTCTWLPQLPPRTNNIVLNHTCLACVSANSDVTAFQLWRTIDFHGLVVCLRSK
jgi:hypothetical protein